MTNKQREILYLLQKTIRRFNKCENYLIENDLSERCICARFAMYLERVLQRSQFADYTADVEYNRGMGGNDHGKKIIAGHDATIDLIVHKRGYNPETGYDNLFAIEMKKRGLPFDDDKNRLQILVDNAYGFGYRAGFAIIIVADEMYNVYELRIDEQFFNEDDF